ncbi:MAG TPA: LytR C-terminal domain-containing protein [Mycobacteriales bacterium]|nr:LytR C-terminal domain-containing protein [Mycobacteriales bacterium]
MWVGAPSGSRLVGALLAVAGVALLVIGLLTLRGQSPDQDKPPAAQPGRSSGAPGTTRPTPTPTTPAGTTPAPTSAAPTTSRPPARTTTPAPPPAVRAPLTVLNNSKVHGLAERVADEARGHGWNVALIGNFAGRLPLTTVYFTPGDATGEKAARQFAAEFPAVDRVLPRYDGLPPTPAGIVLVVTRDWPPDPLTRPGRFN